MANEATSSSSAYPPLPAAPVCWLAACAACATTYRCIRHRPHSCSAFQFPTTALSHVLPSLIPPPAAPASASSPEASRGGSAVADARLIGPSPWDAPDPLQRLTVCSSAQSLSLGTLLSPFPCFLWFRLGSWAIWFLNRILEYKGS